MRTQTKNKWATWSTGKRKWPSLDLFLICICSLEGGAKFPDWSQSEGNQHPCHPALLLTLKRKMLQLPQLKIPVQLLVPPWLKPLFLQLHNTWKKKSESLSKGKSQITSSFLAQTKSHGEQKLKQRSNKIKKLHKINKVKGKIESLIYGLSFFWVALVYVSYENQWVSTLTSNIFIK